MLLAAQVFLLFPLMEGEVGRGLLIATRLCDFIARRAWARRKVFIIAITGRAYVKAKLAKSYTLVSLYCYLIRKLRLEIVSFFLHP